jgi:hypothetical protein
MEIQTRIEALKQAYFWPMEKPNYEPFDWCLGGRGQELIKQIIIEQNVAIMIEIGVSFGGSAKEWLETSPDLLLIGIDPFPNMADYFAKKSDSYKNRIDYKNLDYQSLLNQLKREDGTYLSALSNLWNYRERFIPLRGTSPDKLYDIYEIGLTPDLIYIDSNCKLDELELCQELFPESIIAGYNWNWRLGKAHAASARAPGEYPVRQPLNKFASHYGYEIVTSKSTWVLQKIKNNQTIQADLPLKPDNPIKSRNGLSSIRASLERETCKIAYLGASVTAQKQGYRPVLHEWFQTYFGQPHIEINAGTGGISSTAAVFLMDDDVIEHQPDLCFIEYSTGDMTWTTLEVGLVIEAMVRKLQAINCQVCFLYLYRSDRNFAPDNPILIEYEDIANFHGIPSINVGKYIQESLAAGKIIFEDLYRDHVHNTVAGGQFVTDYITQALESIFESQETEQIGVHKANCARAEAAWALPNRRYLHSDVYAKGKIINIDESMLLNPTNYIVGEFPKPGDKPYQYYQIDDTNEIQFTIKGRLASITSIVGRESGIVEIITPRRTWTFNFWDSYCHYDRFNAKMINLKFDQFTPIRIKLTDKPVDYSQCRREMKDTETIVKNLKVMELLVCGEIISRLLVKHVE